MAIQPFTLLNSTELYSYAPLSFVSHSPCLFFPDDHLLEGRVTTVSKTLAEVVGERILRPLIDSMIRVSAVFFKQAEIIYHQMPSLPSLIPSAQALQVPVQLNYFEDSYEGTFILADYLDLFSKLEITRTDMKQIIRYSGDRVNYEKFLKLDRGKALIKTIINSQYRNLLIFNKILDLDVLSEEIISHPFWIIQPKAGGYNLLHYLIEHEAFLIAKSWMSSSAFNPALLATVNREKQTPLHTAVIKNASQLYPELIKQYQAYDSGEYTPVHYAVKYDRLDFLELLHQHHLLTFKQLEIRCSKPFYPSTSALHFVARSSSPRILDFLIKHQIISMHQEDLFSLQDGSILCNTIHNSQMLEHLLTVYFKETNPLLEAVSSYSRQTPLQAAIALPSSHSMGLLLDHGASMNAKGYGGITPFFVAADNLNMQALEILSLYKDIDFETGNGCTTPLEILTNIGEDSRWSYSNNLSWRRVMTRLLDLQRKRDRNILFKDPTLFIENIVMLEKQITKC